MPSGHPAQQVKTNSSSTPTLPSHPSPILLLLVSDIFLFAFRKYKQALFQFSSLPFSTPSFAFLNLLSFLGKNSCFKVSCGFFVCKESEMSHCIQLFRQRLSNWKALKRTRQYRKAWWVVVVHCCIVKFTSFQRDGRRCYEYLFACVKRNKMDSELLTCLFKIYWVFPRLPFGIVAYAFTLFLDNLCRNSCMYM